MKSFHSYDHLRKEDPKTYKLIGELGASPNYFYRLLPSGGSEWDMKPGHWNVSQNPYFVSGEQWKTLALRCFVFESLHNKSLSEIVLGFHYVMELVCVEGDRYYVPNGCIDGHLQGMFMRINERGEINT